MGFFQAVRLVWAKSTQVQQKASRTLPKTAEWGNPSTVSQERGAGEVLRRNVAIGNAEVRIEPVWRESDRTEMGLIKSMRRAH